MAQLRNPAGDITVGYAIRPVLGLEEGEGGGTVRGC